jgi:hypothetical protein
VLVTTTPAQSDPTSIKDKYHDEVDRLRTKYGIQVEEVAPQVVAGE